MFFIMEITDGRKDADVIDHCFKDASKPVKEKEQKRYDVLCKELGI